MSVALTGAHHGLSTARWPSDTTSGWDRREAMHQPPADRSLPPLRPSAPMAILARQPALPSRSCGGSMSVALTGAHHGLSTARWPSDTTSGWDRREAMHQPPADRSLPPLRPWLAPLASSCPATLYVRWLTTRWRDERCTGPNGHQCSDSPLSTTDYGVLFIYSTTWYMY